MRLIWLLLGVCLADRLIVCKRSCAELCSVEACVTLCERQCTAPSKIFVGTPYLQTHLEFELDGNKQITSSDASSKIHPKRIYFTTLDGGVFRWDAVQRDLHQLYTVQRLALGNGTGLYAVTLNRNFHDNHLLYLHYAEPVGKDDEDIIYMEDGAQPLPVKHYTTIAQYLLEHDQIQPVSNQPILRRHAQFSGKRSGGWMKSSVRNSLAPSNTSTLIYALGGDEEHALVAPQHNYHLSMIHIFTPEEKVQREQMWASGIRNPVSCATSMLKSDYLYCLLQTTPIVRTLFQLKKNVNYGSAKYREVCRGRLCEGSRTPIFGLNGLLNYTNGCPVSSIFIYSGAEMRRFKSHLFLSQDACFSANSFHPTQMLHLAYNDKTGLWTTLPISTQFVDDMLVNTTIMGGDMTDKWYVAGYSLRTGRVSVQSITPLRAA